MRWRTSLVLALGLGGFGLTTGCGPATATVSGEVTVDGQPLEKGFISYVPADGAGAPVTAPVQNGKYELQTVPGNKRVQISAPVVVEKRKEYDGPDAPYIEVTKERLPDRYHANTELTFEVKPGSNTKSWSVESKGRKP